MNYLKSLPISVMLSMIVVIVTYVLALVVAPAGTIALTMCALILFSAVRVLVFLVDE